LDHSIHSPERQDIDRANAFLYEALNIAEQMLRCGAEVGRVEDSLRRMGTAYGAERVEVFSITSSIIVTIYARSFGAVTQTRRITSTSTDLYKLELLNQLSRQICRDHLTPEQIDEELEKIAAAPVYRPWAIALVYALASATFTLFFGGTWHDAAAAAVIGLAIHGATMALSPILSNNFLTMFLLSCLGGLLARILVNLGFGLSVDKICIGNVMLLIPGIPMTNAIRDMFTGDTIAGLSRFLEVLLLAMTIAFGFVLTARFI
jgi:uncharacterized membrane protein YjjP (DUF1212 family)